MVYKKNDFGVIISSSCQTLEKYYLHNIFCNLLKKLTINSRKKSDEFEFSLSLVSCALDILPCVQKLLHDNISLGPVYRKHRTQIPLDRFII